MGDSNSTGTLGFGPEVASAGFDDAELGLSCPESSPQSQVTKVRG